MKIHIDMKDCKFILKPDERRIVCIYYTDPEILIDYLNHNCNVYTDYKEYNILKMRHYYTGIATCAPEDEWNEELGRKIAFSKAKDKCYKSFFKRANTIVQTIDCRLGDMIEMFNDFGLKLENKRQALQDQIDAVVHPTEE